MRSRAVGGAVVALTVASIAACYDPRFDDPLCPAPDHRCPAGLVCDETSETCVAPGTPKGGSGPPDTDVCYGTGLVNICFASAPSGPTGVATSFNTDTECPQVVNGADNSFPDLCVVIGTDVSVPAGHVVVQGSRPLVVIASDTLSVIGTLDVSSRSGTSPQQGAGHNPTPVCSAPTAPQDALEGAGGGAGGSFGSPGGAGGSGNDAGNPPNGAAGGKPGGAIAMPQKLRGGCPGGAGGAGDGQHRGAGGDGGGAVYLIAGKMLTIAGAVYASGGGGGTSTGANGIGQGGGGGGSGGMIGLDAPLISIQGRVVANGGAGGGGGSAGATGGAGSFGGEGTTINWSTRAAAGVGDVNLSGSGGDGAAGTAIGQTGNIDGASGVAGGGGGAGGLGVILVSGALDSNMMPLMISPGSMPPARTH